MESTFALNVLQKLDHSFTITNKLLFRSITRCHRLQVVTDTESRFIFIDVGGYVKQSDGSTFSGFIVYHFLEDLKSTLAKPSIFEGSGT